MTAANWTDPLPPSPRVCPVCSHRGRCTDTKSYPDYIQRRYSCVRNDCGNRWITYEVLPDDDESEGDDGEGKKDIDN